ncbi:MAG: NERD domain-containing protein [Dehalococcoidales bacterium]|jgi:ssDNA-binding Zn-finger/Zn-ribbon topoisomerase 1|nr:NERD domain-containing protein [Dehalococcoidales bacterium]
MSIESTFKGFIGEAQTKLVQTILDPKYHRKYDNVLIKNADDSTQIDHVIVSRYGIFVVETKRWNSDSVIYGSLHDKTWTVFINGGKFSYPNPIRQNYKHKIMLSEYLSIPPENVFAIVYIWGGCKFKKEKPQGVICETSAFSNGYSYIKEIVSHKEVIFTDEEVAKFNQSIQEIQNITNFSDHLKHIHTVKSKHSEQSKSSIMLNTIVARSDVTPKICPKCKEGKLITREAKKGAHAGESFLCCSNFPKCKYRTLLNKKKLEVSSCSNCGTEVQDEYRFCFKCGTKLSNTSASNQ